MGKRVPAEVASPVALLISDGAMPNEEFEIYVTSASCCGSFVCRHGPVRSGEQYSAAGSHH